MSIDLHANRSRVARSVQPMTTPYTPRPSSGPGAYFELTSSDCRAPVSTEHEAARRGSAGAALKWAKSKLLLAGVMVHVRRLRVDAGVGAVGVSGGPRLVNESVSEYGCGGSEAPSESAGAIGLEPSSRA